MFTAALSRTLRHSSNQLAQRVAISSSGLSRTAGAAAASLHRHTTPHTATPRYFSDAIKNSPTWALEPAFPEGSIYRREKDGDLFRDVVFETEGTDLDDNANVALRQHVNQLFQDHKPSKHPFFANLKAASPDVVKNPGWLQEFYRRYQAAMHCTRVAVYWSPGTSTATLRQKKLAIIADDDAIDKRSHHGQLEDMFRFFGCEPDGENYFGDLEPLAAKSDPATARFVRFVNQAYRESTGSWCIAEVVSDDWLSALADSFTPFFPDVKQCEYFDEVFSGHVEIRHMLETMAITEIVIANDPAMFDTIITNMKDMCVELDRVWDNLDSLVANPEPYLS